MDTYEEKYKEIVGQIRKAYLYAQTDSTKAVLEEIFPELKENEDEKILVIIKHCIECRYRKTSTIQGISMEQCFAWLERQGEHANFRNKIQVGDKVTRNEAGVLVNLSQLKRVARPSEKQGEQNFEMKTAEESLGIDSDTYNKIVDECIFDEQKPTDKVEPKFREGEWITNGDYTWKIVEVKPLDYILQSQDGNVVDDTISHVDEQFHSFTIQDAKDGDVLKEDSCIFILEKIKSQDTAIPHCCLFDDGNFNLSSKICFDVDSTYPATKEQRDTLLKAMADAGYTFDFERKELKRIVQKPEENKGNLGGISPTWSEEDKNFMYDTLSNLTELKDRYGESYGNVGKCIDWVKSLKGRVQPKQEWSEEDEQILQGIWDEILANKHDAKECEWKTYDKFLDWLKSIKDRVQPQPKQEWSEEDKKNLRRAIRTTKVVYPETADWLKSLRPQNTYNPYKAVVESIAEMCKHYDKASHSGLRDFYDNVKVKCKDAQEYDSLYPQSRWKPSELQLGCLSDAIEYYNSFGYPAPKLKELYE